MNILIVDDERQFVKALVAILKQNKFNVDFAFDGEDGLDKALSNIYDVIVLDIMMPKINGFEVLKEIRNNKISTPVLMLSAKSEISDKVQGLNLGADDYLTKPFNSDELMARIKALLRRKTQFVGDELSFGDLKLSRDTYSLVCNDETIALGKKEFQIMEVLISNANKTINKERLLEKIWGYDSEAEYNAIEVYVSFLRKKMTALNSKCIIKSLRGIGYILQSGEENA